MNNGHQEASFYFYRGRVALCALLRGLGLRSGDEVLLQAFTCLAVPAPILGLGLVPAYVDIEKSSYNMDFKQAEARVTPKTKAIILQHTFGIPADIDAALALARRHGLALIEDCCHVLGSTYRGKEVGSIGDAAFFSFEWGKPIVIGLGGMAIVNSKELAGRVRSLHSQLVAPPTTDVLRVQMQYFAHRLFRRPALFWWLRAVYRALSNLGVLIGGFPETKSFTTLCDDYSRRMPSAMQARLARVTRTVKSQMAHRKELGMRYEMGFKELGLPCVEVLPGSDPVFLRYPLLVKDKARVISEARRERIELGDWFNTPIHPVPEEVWRTVGYEKGICPVAEYASKRIVTCPLHESVRLADVDRSLRFFGKLKELGLIETSLAPSRAASHASIQTEKSVLS
jgi:perosamine synthetase